MYFEILSDMSAVETIATGSGIREIARAEIHWYEATGIGKCELKIKRLIEAKRHD